MWERRYGVVEPDRTQGRNRLYTREDIARLALIKRLVDEGNAISTIANLTFAQLQERIQFHVEPSEPHTCRIAVLGDALPAKIARNNVDLQGIETVAVYRDRQRFTLECGSLQADVIVIEYPTIHADTASELSQLLLRSGAKRAVVIYGFGRHDILRQLENEGITPLRAPVNLLELRHACLAGETGESAPIAAFEPPSAPSKAIPPRFYSNETLAVIAASSTVVHCECPQHLAELVLSLTAFEQYSKECINRSPDDAELHAYLHITTARARSLMEEGLARITKPDHVNSGRHSED